MKKIVIAPIFNDTHLVKLQIPNIIKSINPDYILYNEGMFPSGPESTTFVTNHFLQTYTLDGRRGFDYEELQDVISDAQKEYKDTTCSKRKKKILNKIKRQTISYEDSVAKYKKDLDIAS